MGYTSYSTINQYGEVSFIGGSDVIFEFDVMDDNGNSDMAGATSMTWKLCKFGEPDVNIIELFMNEEDPHDDSADIYVKESEPWKIFVKISASKTTNLFGKFTHQLTITIDQLVFTPSQGIVLIVPKIK